MKLGIVGDGLLANILLLRLAELGFDGEIVWFRGRTPTTPPVALLHKHVGQSFDVDSDRLKAWDVAFDFFTKLSHDSDAPIVSAVEVLRPSNSGSRLTKSFEKLAREGVTKFPASDYPYLKQCDHVFSYQGFAIDVARLLETLESASTQSLNIVEVGPVKSFVSDIRGEVRLVEMNGTEHLLDQVVISSGAASARWLHGVDLKSWPGELAISKRPEGLPDGIAISRNGHVVPLLDGEYICSGATYLLPDSPRRVMTRRRDPRLAIKEALQGVRQNIIPIDRFIPESMLEPPSRNGHTLSETSENLGDEKSSPFDETTNVKSWYGIRAICHPDRRPIVGRIQDSGVIVATAFGSKGMFWAPIVSHVIADIINGLVEKSPYSSICTTRIPSLSLTLA